MYTKTESAIGCMVFLFGLVWLAVIGFVVGHFIAKFW